MGRNLSASESLRAMDRNGVREMMKKYKHLNLTWIRCVECDFMCPLEYSDMEIDGKARHATCEPPPPDPTKKKKQKKGAPGENQNAFNL